MTPSDAKDFFRSCGRAKKTLDRLRCRLEALKSPTYGSGEMPVMGGGHSDPTQRTAMAIIDTETEMAEAERELEERLELCSQVCNGVGRALGFDVGFALKDHYVRGYTLDSVANSLGIARSTLSLMCASAYEYVATVGISMAAKGMGIATTDDVGRLSNA